MKTARIVSAFALFATLLACGTEDLIGEVFPPTIAAVTPNAGSVGSTVTVSGTFLSKNGSPYVVKFNGLTASNVTAINDGQLSVVVPIGATSGPVTVTNPNGGDPLVSNSVTFTVN